MSARLLAWLELDAPPGIHNHVVYLPAGDLPEVGEWLRAPWLDQPKDISGYRVHPTTKTGIHTGRRRYFVQCTLCDEVLHEETTGPLENIARHEREGCDAIATRSLTDYTKMPK